MTAEDQHGWHASLHLGFEPRGDRTVLATRRQRGPLAVQRAFYPEGGPCHIYLLHPPGGVVGGDRLAINVAVAEGGHALITTPGASKFYRSAGPEARLHQRLVVDDGGVLEWFPQANILFPGANLRARTDVELTRGARFLGWEILSLGRAVIKERFDHGAADLWFRVHRDGRPILIDRLRLRSKPDLDGISGLRGYPISATFIATGVNRQDLDAVRESLPHSDAAPFGTTLLEDLLVARCLDRSVESVERLFVALWGILRPGLLGRQPCSPRIWAT